MRYVDMRKCDISGIFSSFRNGCCSILEENVQSTAGGSLIGGVYLCAAKRTFVVKVQKSDQ